MSDNARNRQRRLSFDNMEKGILLMFMLVCHSHQRPSSSSSSPPPPSSNVEVMTASSSASTAGTESTDGRTPATEGPKKLDSQDKIAGHVTETAAEITAATAATVTAVTATAVSVRSFLNVSSPFSPSQVFEDFKPSTHYRPHDGDPVREKLDPGQVTSEPFYEPRHLKRPDAAAYDRPTPKPNEKKVMAFPTVAATTRERYYSAGGHVQYDGNNNVRSNGPAAEPRSPYAFNVVLPQYKPIKHDAGEGQLLPPNFVHRDNDLYDKHFGKQYHGNNDMISNSYYPDAVQDGPPKSSYHNTAITTHKKKDPWRSLLSVLATILPVGLLLASFPPTIIKVNSTQYPYQFQKNATSYNPVNVISGRYKALGKQTVAGRKIHDDVDDLPGYLDDCLKNKICENMKTNNFATNNSPSELDFLLQSDKLNWTRDVDQMTEIAEIAASASPESCRVQFVCNDRTI
ncbi:Hypothetical protein CINCED_3A025276 [Cinara cedri]|uniref:Uncharacterized protein n=1 Tax=Cinara cedri TaxID=506608 RepID=A0A5E4M0Y8_9HEMI|nr:Hypothetical protein CINCED_3A025276 [Cinara cedri]